MKNSNQKIFNHMTTLTGGDKTPEETIRLTLGLETALQAAEVYNEVIQAMQAYRSQFPSPQEVGAFPDTEADGYVFCGKCGQMKKS